MVAVTNESFFSALQEYFGDSEFKVFQLAGDASNRRYYRVQHGQQAFVLMSWEPFQEKDYPFLSVQQHFARNQVHVPEIIRKWPERGLLLQEDLGDLTLERKFWENQSPENSMSFYYKAIDELIKIHFLSTQDKSSPCTAFQIQFDTEKLLWEMNYGFNNLLLGLCKLEINEVKKDELMSCFKAICEKLHNQPKWIAHRDYHSRNLMIKFDKMYVIDFQDARMGTLQYDLVSLLKDSYVDIPDSMADDLLKDYLIKAKDFLPKDFSREKFDHIYEVQSIQRCFKACGSFASFFHLRSDRRYLKHIQPTLKRVIKSLVNFPEYKVMTNILIDSGSLDIKYEDL